MKTHLSSILLLLSALMLGCDRIKVAEYSEFTHVSPEGMPEGWEYVFAPSKTDSTLSLDGKYDIIIALRYSNRCPSQSVILNVEEFSLVHDEPETGTLEIPLFDSEGYPVGRGTYGVYEVTDTIHRGYAIPEGYVLSLSSPLPASATKGIKALGLIISQ